MLPNRSVSNGVRINRRNSKIGGTGPPPPCGGGVTVTYKYAPPHTCYPAEYGRSICQTVRVLFRSAWKTTLAPPIKITEGHRNRHESIRHLWIPINVP